MKEHVFRAPRHGARYWVALFAGCLEMLFAFLLPIAYWAFRLVMLCLGLAIALLEASEVLPGDRPILTGLLRIGSYVALFLMMVAVIITTTTYPRV